MPTVILYGDTIRHASLRHEVPLEILDPILIVLGDGPPRVLTSSLELSRIATAVPEAQLATFNALGLFELIDAGRSREEAELETVLRALQEWGVREALVAPDFPVAVADHVRAAGIRLDVATDTVGARRRVKNEAELAGIRRAVRAAEQGLAAGERLIRAAAPEGELLHLGGAPLTADRVRAAIREACAAAGAPAPPDIIVTSVLEQGGGHDPGSGPLPAGLPICIDLWPRDEASGCWADMARTFINGPVPPRVAELWSSCARRSRRHARRRGRASRAASCTTSPRTSSSAPASRRSGRASPARCSTTASTSRSATASGSRCTSRRTSASRAATGSSPAT